MTEKTRVVHVKDNAPGAIYIGRSVSRQRLKASKWANPYKIGDTSLYNPRGVYVPNDSESSTYEDRAPLSRFDVLERYERRILSSSELRKALPELQGKPLACWCRHDGEPKSPQNLCHGDILVRLLDKYSDTTTGRCETGNEEG